VLASVDTIKGSLFLESATSHAESTNPTLDAKTNKTQTPPEVSDNAEPEHDGYVKHSIKNSFINLFAALIEHCNYMIFACKPGNFKYKRSSRNTFLNDVKCFYQLMDMNARFANHLSWGTNNKNEQQHSHITDNFMALGWVTLTMIVLWSWTNLLRYINHCRTGDLCNHDKLLAYYTLGFTTSAISQLLCYMLGTTVLGCILCASELFNLTAKKWLHRFKSLRRVELENTVIANMEDIGIMVRKDAYERYLMIQHFMYQAGKLWGTKLFCGVLGACGVLIYCYVYVLFCIQENENIMSTCVMPIIVGAFAAAVFAFLLFCIAHANSTVEKIRVGFITASCRDYQLLGDQGGGKEEWLEFTTESPAYWYILGFAVTRSWIYGVITGAVSAVVSAVVLSQI
jgi:hypothetical protein